MNKYWYTFFLLTYAYSPHLANATENKQFVAKFLQDMGYSSACVTNVMSTCERYNANFQKQVAAILPELKSFIRETLSDKKESPNTGTVVNINSNSRASFDEYKLLLGELVSDIKLQNNYVINDCLKNIEFNDLKMAKDQVKLCNKLTESAKVSKNCAEIYSLGDTASGVRIIYPSGESKDKPVVVFCDQTTDGGGWTVIQNRAVLPTRENFLRNWKEYQEGFGNIYGEFWLGLENIRDLVKSIPTELRVELEDYEGSTRFAKYGTFSIGDADSEYTLNVGEYTGNAGDSLAKRHNGYKFSTYDNDNDLSKENCASERHGAWWYTDCNDSNLNGFPHVQEESSNYHGIQWETFHGGYYSLKTASMKIRPVYFLAKPPLPA